MKIGRITISDRAAAGQYADLSGPEIERLAGVWFGADTEFVSMMVPDEVPLIIAAMVQQADELGCDLILTTGGTGISPRDVTPEATEAVCQKMMPGFGELMRLESLKVVPTAILSRQTAGIRGSSLIVNLPGKPSAIADCLSAVMPAIPYCVDLIGGPRLETDPERCKAFRPKGK